MLLAGPPPSPPHHHHSSDSSSSRYLTYMDGCTEPFADSLLKRAGLDSVMEYAVKKLLKLRLHQAHDVASSSSSESALHRVFMSLLMVYRCYCK